MFHPSIKLNTRMSATTSDITLTARCHCSLFNHTFNLPSAAFPLKASVCSCNTCRYVSGHLFASFAVIPLPTPEEAFFKDLIKYESSNTLSRYFCPRCGASVLNVDKDEWEFATGILEIDGGLDGKLDRVVLWVGDTGDGGAARWINAGKVEGLVGRKMGGRDSQDVTDGMLAAFEKLAESKFLGATDKVVANCHCGDVKFDVLKPDGERYAAGLCACESCRRTSGFEINAWVSVARDKVQWDKGNFRELLNGCGKYQATEKAERYFCKRCGAQVAYVRDEWNWYEIAGGLLRALEGSRAESILWWNKSDIGVEYIEDARDQEFANKIKQGLEATTKPKARSRPRDE